jgi:hypothetical protein
MTRSSRVIRYVKHLTCCYTGNKRYLYAQRTIQICTQKPHARCTCTTTKPDMHAQKHNSPRTVRQNLRVHYLVFECVCVSLVRGPDQGPSVAGAAPATPLMIIRIPEASSATGSCDVSITFLLASVPVVDMLLCAYSQRCT